MSEKFREDFNNLIAINTASGATKFCEYLKGVLHDLRKEKENAYGVDRVSTFYGADGTPIQVEVNERTERISYAELEVMYLSRLSMHFTENNKFIAKTLFENNYALLPQELDPIAMESLRQFEYINLDDINIDEFNDIKDNLKEDGDFVVRSMGYLFINDKQSKLLLDKVTTALAVQRRIKNNRKENKKKSKKQYTKKKTAKKARKKGRR